MTVRTSIKTVTFQRPFVLGDPDDVLPPGDYTVETQEELVPGVSFIAYRRVSVMIHLPAPSGDPALTRFVVMHPRELDSALLRDAALDDDPA